MKAKVESSVLLLTAVLWLLPSVVFSSHFRGGVFMVRPKPGGEPKEVSDTGILKLRFAYLNTNNNNIVGSCKMYGPYNAQTNRYLIRVAII